MITRYYVCDSCNYSFEHTHQSIHDLLETRCPKCNKHDLYQDLSGQHSFVYKDPKTVGHLAERNTSRMGKYELESARQKGPQKKKKIEPWYNPDGKDLTKELAKLDTEEKKQNYIIRGET